MGSTGGHSKSRSVTGPGAGGTGGHSETKSVTGEGHAYLPAHGWLAAFEIMHGQGTRRVGLQIQTHTDWRRPAPGSMLRWTLLKKGTMKASLWGLNSTALLNLHARLLRNQHLPVLSVKMPTRGEHDWQYYTCALNVHLYPALCMFKRYNISFVPLQGGRGLLLQKGS